jgi:hypothetical protein
MHNIYDTFICMYLYMQKNIYVHVYIRISKTAIDVDVH